MHMGHLLWHRSAHSTQAIMCPQGVATVVISRSQHMRHRLLLSSVPMGSLSEERALKNRSAGGEAVGGVVSVLSEPELSKEEVRVGGTLFERSVAAVDIPPVEPKGLMRSMKEFTIEGGAG